MTEPKARRGWWKWAMVAALALALWFSPVFERARTDYDEDFIPWDLTGFAAWFQNEPFAEQRLLGTVSPIGYEQREFGRGQCRALAQMEAQRLQIATGWSYVCCTQTRESSCKTKVK